MGSEVYRDKSIMIITLRKKKKEGKTPCNFISLQASLPLSFDHRGVTAALVSLWSKQQQEPVSSKLKENNNNGVPTFLLCL